jgi:hypothetical protein
MSNIGLIVKMETRLKELIAGAVPNNVSERAFLSGYRGASNGKVLLHAYLEFLETEEDAEDIDRTLFILGYSTGLEMLNQMFANIDTGKQDA